ncbi:MAG TPA: pyridoxal-dependent decarboxylase, exosortase A system-associated [Firmicutes bacterium]|nr:pyridoxal-dependent decarboxylase, exosortase A system-associated [Bacillota bacterium]
MTSQEHRNTERIVSWMSRNKGVQTPFYLYDEEMMRRQIRRLRRILPVNAEIFFSMKANPNLHIVRLLARQGCGVEIASGGELKTALRAGVLPENIIFAGPAKRDVELEAALTGGIRAVNVESLKELERLSFMSRRLKRHQKIHLRINPPFDIQGSGVKMGGGAKKFGIDSEQIGEAKTLLRHSPLLRCEGFHVFAATQIDDEKKALENFSLSIALMKECAKLLDISLSSLDIGSGLGIPYGDSPEKINDEALRSGLQSLFEKEGLLSKKVLVESGRFLTGQAGYFVTRVLDKKNSRGVTYLLCDGGIQNLLRPALIGDHHEICCLGTKAVSEPKEKVTVAGPLCTSLDVLGENIEMERAEIGDYLCVGQAGAYGYTESMPLFLSHPMPDEYLQDSSGAIRRIRKGLSYDEILRSQEETGNE